MSLQTQNMTTVEYTSLDKNNLINVWPNPFSGNDLNIQLNVRNIKSGMIQLVGLTGEIIVQETINQNRQTIRFEGLSELPSGVYFLRVVADNRAEVAKIVKQ